MDFDRKVCFNHTKCKLYKSDNAALTTGIPVKGNTGTPVERCVWGNHTKFELDKSDNAALTTGIPMKENTGLRPRASCIFAR